MESFDEKKERKKKERKKEREKKKKYTIASAFAFVRLGGKRESIGGKRGVGEGATTIDTEMKSKRKGRI